VKHELALVYCDSEGSIYGEPEMGAVFRIGRRFVAARKDECIKLPFGTEIFSLPGRSPYALTRGSDPKRIDSLYDMQIDAASAFLPSGYLRTYLPAFKERKGAKRLSLWAYAGIGIDGDDFYAPAFRIDDDVRSDPAIHSNDDELAEKVQELLALYPKNRLVKQLSRCAQEYRCLCARNFFLSRHEAPVPTSPACNSGCLGCLSHQDESSSGFGASQYRLDFAPDANEIAEVILHHFNRVPEGIASFGQGCEGEPLMRADTLAEAVRIVRSHTSDGTIHLNTNGSLTSSAAKLIDAGIDSIRVSLNSPDEKYYNPYYLPRGYSFNDVMNTVQLSVEKMIYVSVNLFFLPGFTDAQDQYDSLCAFLQRYPVQMIQTRNLNIDPDYYLDTIAYSESEPIGVRKCIENLRRDFPKVRLGYYNPRKSEFK
jgi:pyruvate-formate lyase-activating enzyme